MKTRRVRRWLSNAECVLRSVAERRRASEDMCRCKGGKVTWFSEEDARKTQVFRVRRGTSELRLRRRERRESAT